MVMMPWLDRPESASPAVSTPASSRSATAPTRTMSVASCVRPSTDSTSTITPIVSHACQPRAAQMPASIVSVLSCLDAPVRIGRGPGADMAALVPGPCMPTCYR